jgi:hypothetical protein
VKVGAEARVVPAAFPDKTLQGTVDQVAIAPRQHPGPEQELPVRIRLTEHRGTSIFHPGMSCRAEVLTALQAIAEGARGACAGAALRGQPGQIRQAEKIGGQRVHAIATAAPRSAPSTTGPPTTATSRITRA